MKIYIGCDHAGFELKQKLITHFVQNKSSDLANKNSWEWIDEGCFSADSVDYPDLADKVCLQIHRSETKKTEADSLLAPALGLLICGSGQGMAMRANKYKNIRAALCWKPEIAQLSRTHNNANLLCLASRFTTFEEALAMIEIFFNTRFEGGRHLLRVDKISLPTPT